MNNNIVNEIYKFFSNKAVQCLLDNLTTEDKMVNTICLVTIIAIADEGSPRKPVERIWSEFNSYSWVVPEEDMTAEILDEKFNIFHYYGGGDGVMEICKMIKNSIPDIKDYILSSEELGL